MEKMALTESEHEKWKSNVEMKELELVELKKRYEKVSTEKVRIILNSVEDFVEDLFLFLFSRQNDFFAAKLDYIPMANVSYDEMEDKQLSPTGSEDSYADTSFSAGADGPQHNAGLFGLDNFFLGTRNQDNNGHRVTAGSNASIEQSRQSVLQENPNRLSINEAQVQSGNQSIRNADQRFPDGSLTRDARNCASVRQPDDLDETAKDDHNQGNDGRRSTYDSGTSKGQPRQSIFRENPNRMPTNGAKEQPAKQPLAKKQPTPSTAHRVIHKDDVSARKSVDLDDFTHGNRNDGRDNAGGTGSSTGQGSQANRKPNNGGNQQSVYQPSVNKQPNPSTFHQVANKGDAATYKPVEPDAFSHGNRNDDRRYASGAGGSAGQPNEGALQENGNRKAANGAKAQPAKKPPADPQSSTSSAVHRSVDARQKSFVAVRDIKQLREEPYRNRSPSQCSTLSFHSTVGIKRRQPPTEYNAGMARPEERPPQPKKMSPLIQSDAHTNQSFRMPSSSDNQVSRHMAASAQKPSVQKQNPPVFTGEGQPAQFDPKTLTSAEADSDSREQKANPSINDNEMRSESSDDWLNENGSAQSEPQKNDETNVSFDFVSDDEKKTMSQQTGHGSNEKPRKRNANDGDGLKKMDGNGEVKKNKTGAANEEFEVAADDFRFDDNSMNDFGFGNVDLLPDFNPAEFTSYNTAEYGEYKATDDSFRLDEPYNYANDDELQSPGVRRFKSFQRKRSHFYGFVFFPSICRWSLVHTIFFSDQHEHFRYIYLFVNSLRVQQSPYKQTRYPFINNFIFL